MVALSSTPVSNESYVNCDSIERMNLRGVSELGWR